MSSGGYYNGPVADWARRNIGGRVEVTPGFSSRLGGITVSGRTSRAGNNGMALTSRLAPAGREPLWRKRRVPLPAAFRASYSPGSPLS
jgi:hypothetical protein